MTRNVSLRVYFSFLFPTWSLRIDGTTTKVALLLPRAFVPVSEVDMGLHWAQDSALFAVRETSARTQSDLPMPISSARSPLPS